MSQAMAVEHDVDMTEDIDVGEDSETVTDRQNLVRGYIVIDTNILLECLPTVQALFGILSLPVLKSAIQVLIPLTVLYGTSSYLKRY